ncbi:Mitochondrial export protein Som1 [Nakaseomyces glabratus]|nr:Mitochondrial export protein Som1 [Nakaseomyces glabratus]KAH7608912.1 Mitochondrial export protein Som1 [Nakaseomyces glabratus]KAH7615279.1 Mitochondrial export protein Som1 [Nakaseomyces glabratus]
MAPPTPVIDGIPADASRDCPLKSLTQYHCAPNTHGQGVHKDMFVCIPFTRLFKQCADRAIEVTTEHTNI